MIKLHLEQGRTVASIEQEYSLLKNLLHNCIQKYREEGQYNPEIQKEFGLRWFFKQFNLSSNGYYNYLKDRTHEYRLKKATLKTKITQVYHQYGGKMGYRKIHLYLKKEGVKISKPTTHKYMKEVS